MSIKSTIQEKIEKAAGLMTGKEKQNAEVRFWEKEIKRYVEWYDGNIKELYGHPSPVTNKVIAATKELSAILTFFQIHQKPAAGKRVRPDARCRIHLAPVLPLSPLNGELIDKRTSIQKPMRRRSCDRSRDARQ